jgi:CheY-like chemotaxis protein
MTRDGPAPAHSTAIRVPSADATVEIDVCASPAEATIPTLNTTTTAIARITAPYSADEGFSVKPVTAGRIASIRMVEVVCASSETRAQRSSWMSLLFVHTDSDDRSMYADYLRAEGFAVDEIGTTHDALPFAGDTEALITGLMVPGELDPVEFIRLVRAQHNTLPIIVVTACVLDDRMAEAHGAGANVVLTKPCLPDTLLLAVKATLEGQDVTLVPPPPRRTVAERRLTPRGGRRPGE